MSLMGHSRPSRVEVAWLRLTLFPKT
jgi:hypothetical protein